MRAARLLLLLTLLLAPAGGAAGAPAAPRSGDGAADLIVLLEEGASPAPALALAPHAIPLRVLAGFVVPDATGSLEAALREAPGVARVQRAAPLELHGHASLRLTRAAPGADGLGDLSYTGRGVTVAVIDSGIDATHPDLTGRVKTNLRLVEGRFAEVAGDLTGHGTHVAGIVAASGASGGHRGVAPDAELVGIDITSRFTTASAVLAYDWLYVNHQHEGIRAVVNAWGRMGRGAFDPEDAVVRAIDRLVESGVVVLFSSSNHGPHPSSLSFESQNPRVVTVGATDDAGLLMAYSSRGPALGAAAGAVKPDVVAPGEAIVSARSLQSPLEPDAPDAFHRTLSGTSQSVPHVAGIVALMLEAAPHLRPIDVQRALHASAIDLGPEGPDDLTGFGLVDARDALRLALGEQPDRANLLVAGGTERHEGATNVPPPDRRGLAGLLGNGGERDLWTFPFPVKEGATRLAFTVSWPATAGTNLPLSATLMAEDGRPAGTWRDLQPEGDRISLAGELDAPAAGNWALHVRGAAPVALDLRAVVDVTLPPNATRAAALDPRYRLPDEPPRADGPMGGLDVLWAKARLVNAAHPWALPALMVACMGGLVALWQRPRTYVPPPRPDEAPPSAAEPPQR